MKHSLLLTLFILAASTAIAKNLTPNKAATVMELLVRESNSITLVDRDGQALPRANQLPSLIASALVTGFDDASKPGAKNIALEQSKVTCKQLPASAPKEEELCTVVMMDTDFDVANAGYQLTKLEDASGAWILDVHIERANGGAWNLKNKIIKAFYAE